MMDGYGDISFSAVFKEFCIKHQVQLFVSPEPDRSFCIKVLISTLDNSAAISCVFDFDELSSLRINIDHVILYELTKALKMLKEKTGE